MRNKKIIIIVLALLLAILTAFALYMAVIKNNNADSKTCTTYSNRAEKQCVEDYIGLTQQEAVNRAKQHKYNPKIVSIDGKEQPLNDDRGSIIYLEVTDGHVSKAYFE